jgi:hypothetical protein
VFDGPGCGRQVKEGRQEAFLLGKDGGGIYGMPKKETALAKNIPVFCLTGFFKHRVRYLSSEKGSRGPLSNKRGLRLGMDINRVVQGRMRSRVLVFHEV